MHFAVVVTPFCCEWAKPAQPVVVSLQANSNSKRKVHIMQFGNFKNITTTTKKVLAGALFAAMALVGGVKAQELVKGAFMLNAETRFGSTVLPAGHYTVSIAPVTALAASGTRVLVFVRPESKAGPVASILAMASSEACETPSGLTLVSESSGMVARSLCLNKQGLAIDFDLPHAIDAAKIKATVAAQQ
jgi:hypothetical protein